MHFILKIKEIDEFLSFPAHSFATLKHKSVFKIKLP